jgi:hypothetical protein
VLVVVLVLDLAATKGGHDPCNYFVPLCEFSSTTSTPKSQVLLRHGDLGVNHLPNGGHLEKPPLFELRRVREPSKVAP